MVEQICYKLESEYCVPYPIIVCAEALVRVWLLEMLLRHTTLNICMYIHKHMYINNEREKKRRERERASEKRAGEKEREKERDRKRDRVRERESIKRVSRREKETL
jgi:hypothetical protein